jgi:hypothetical protein
MRKGIGNTHIKRGVIINAPPNPLSLLMTPPRTAAKMSRQIETKLSKIK